MIDRTCDQCKCRRRGCTRTFPTCQRCAQRGLQCTYSAPLRPIGRPKTLDRMQAENPVFPHISLVSDKSMLKHLPSFLPPAALRWAPSHRHIDTAYETSLHLDKDG